MKKPAQALSSSLGNFKIVINTNKIYLSVVKVLRQILEQI